jgi:peptide/nickel transport system permease protein
VSILLFWIIHLPPGGPIDVYAASGGLTADDIARLKHQYGLDEPVPIQYVHWITAVVQGDWGTSFIEKRPVTTVILGRVPASLLLTLTSFALSVVVAVPIGLLSATRGKRLAAGLVEWLAMLGIAMPTFWLGLIAIFLFSVVLRVLPAGDMFTIGAPFSIPDRIQHLIMPVVVASVFWIAAWSRYVRGSMLEVMRQEYVVSARSRGLSEVVVVTRHMLKNALLPFITELGLHFPRIISGIVVVEIVFAWPGIGRLLMQSILQKDYPVAMGVFMAASLLVVLGNIFADIMYSVIDPRVRY